MNTLSPAAPHKPGKDFVYTAIKYSFGAILAFLLVLLLGFENSEYACKVWFLMSNKLLLLLWIVIAALGILWDRFWKKTGRLGVGALDYDRIVRWMALLFLPIQIYVFYNAFFLTGWDVGAVRDYAVQLISGELRFNLYAQDYFSHYPNNILLLLICTVILRANIAFGIFTGEYTVMCCTVANCLISSLTCWLVYRTAQLFVKKSRAFAAYCLCVILVGLSPWNILFYSDSVGLLFPILSFWLFYRPTATSRTRHLSRFGSVLTAVVGYYIKPQCAIVLIAIVLIELISAIGNGNHRKLLGTLSILVTAAVCFVLVSAAVETAYRQCSGLPIVEEQTVGPEHFMMMGLNEECGGVFSDADAAFSLSIYDSSQRTAANLVVIGERLRKMGPAGLARHICKKLLCSFNDGSFAWGVEGSFYLHIPEPLNSRSAPFFRSLFHHGGKLNPYYFQTAQFFWFGTLLFALLSIGKSHPEHLRPGVSGLWLSVLGLVLYLALFEVRARYVYIYVPFFILLAVMGLEALVERINKAQ